MKNNLVEVRHYKSVTKTVLIAEVIKKLELLDKDEFARSASMILGVTIESTDNSTLVKYWHPSQESYRVFFQKVAEHIFIVTAQDQRRTNADPKIHDSIIVVELENYNRDVTEACLNRFGYTMNERKRRLRNIFLEHGEDAEGMIAVFLSNKLTPSNDNIGFYTYVTSVLP